MTTDYIYSLGLTDLQNFANECKELTIRTLLTEGYLGGDPDALCLEYNIILHRKGVLGRVMDKFFNADDTSAFRLTVMKMIKEVKDGE